MSEHRRTIDIVLEPGYLDDISEADLDDLRQRREAAEDVESQISYYRRLLHGRVDLLDFELRRRSGQEERSLIEAPPEILASGMTLGNEPNLRHLDTMPPLPASTGRRLIDKIMDDGILTQLLELTDERGPRGDRSCAEVEVGSRRSGASCMSSSTPCRTRSSPAIAASRARHSQRAEGCSQPEHGPAWSRRCTMGRWLSSRPTAPWSPTPATSISPSTSALRPSRSRHSPHRSTAPGWGLSSSPWPVLPMTGIRCTSGWWSRCWPESGSAKPISSARPAGRCRMRRRTVSGSRWVEWGGHEPFGTTARASMRDGSGLPCPWLAARRLPGPDHPLQVVLTDVVTDLGGFRRRRWVLTGAGRPSIARRPGPWPPSIPASPRFRGSGRSSTPCTGIRPLVSGTGNGDASIATALNAAVKRGAAGCIGVAIDRRFGVAVKSWDGIQEVADSAAIATLSELGELPRVATDRLAPLARPTVLGGGRPVGELEPRVELKWE